MLLKEVKYFENYDASQSCHCKNITEQTYTNLQKYANHSAWVLDALKRLGKYEVV